MLFKFKCTTRLRFIPVEAQVFYGAVDDFSGSDAEGETNTEENAERLLKGLTIAVAASATGFFHQITGWT